MADKFYIVTRQSDPKLRRWEWEIYRNGKPMGARLRGGDYSSKNSAEKAGVRRLHEFLAALDRERGAE